MEMPFLSGGHWKASANPADNESGWFGKKVDKLVYPPGEGE